MTKGDFNFELHTAIGTALEVVRELNSCDFYRAHMPRKDLRERIVRARALLATLGQEIEAFAVQFEPKADPNSEPPRNHADCDPYAEHRMDAADVGDA